jgi:hypothetical protein
VSLDVADAGRSARESVAELEVLGVGGSPIESSWIELAPSKNVTEKSKVKTHVPSRLYLPLRRSR